MIISCITRLLSSCSITTNNFITSWSDAISSRTDLCGLFLSMMRGPRACPLSQRVSECRTVHAVKQSTAPDTCKRLTNILPLLVLLCVLSLFNKDTTYLRGKLLCALIIDYNIIIMILHSPSLTKMEATPSLPEEVTNDVGR